MELELVRDKISEFLLVREVAQLRISSHFFHKTELKLRLYCLPRKVRALFIDFLPDEWAEEIAETCFERLALVSKSCWYSCRPLTRNYLRAA